MEDRNLCQAIAQPHDVGYKHLFSSKKVFLEFLQSFVQQSWVEKIDEIEISTIGNEFVNKIFQKRVADVIYELKLKGREGTFYILLEFQATIDPSMPYRLHSYIAEVWRKTLTNDVQTDQTRQEFTLPVVVGIVLYNGQRTWGVSNQLKEIQKYYEEFTDDIMNFRYYVIDINRYHPDELVQLANCIGTIFYLEQRYGIIELELIERLKRISHILKKMNLTEFEIVSTWLVQIVARDVSSETLKRVKEILYQAKPWEVESMISNIEIAMRRSLEAAEARGEAKGKAEGRAEGKVEGKAEGYLELLQKMLKTSIPVEQIAGCTEFTLAELEKMKKELMHH